MSKNRVTKVVSPSKGVILQSKKFGTEKWPNVIYAFETSQENVPTGIEGVEIPEIKTDVVTYVRMDLLSPETISELQNKLKSEKDILQ